MEEKLEEIRRLLSNVDDKTGQLEESIDEYLNDSDMLSTEHANHLNQLKDDLDQLKFTITNYQEFQGWI